MGGSGLGSPEVTVGYCLGLQSFDGVAGARGSTSQGPCVCLTQSCRLALAVDKRPGALSTGLIEYLHGTL